MVFDLHIHYDADTPPEESVAFFKGFMKKHDIEKGVVLSYCYWREDDDHLHSNYKCLWLKDAMSPQMFAYMSFLHSFDKHFSAEQYLKQLNDGIEMGFDGFKSLDGKPDSRKRLGLSLADSRFDLAYEKMQEIGFPITMHVADPEYFWHKPDAYCYYGGGDFLTKQQLYSEVNELLTKFPRLTLTLAHFYFLSENAELAAKFLDDHPTVSFDLAPGREMFVDFSKNTSLWRDFFKTYKTRIFVGSDINNSPRDVGYMNDVYKLLKCGTGSGEPFFAIDNTFNPLELDEETLSYIMYKNAARLLGETPKPINRPAVKRCFEEFLLQYKDLLQDSFAELARFARDFDVEL